MLAQRLALIILLSSAPLSAQATLGSAAVSGSVRDETGAAVPGAKVVLVETGRHLAREATTNDTGSYLFPTVSAGIYSVTVSKPAFQTYELSDVRVEVGQRAALDIILKVGAVSSVVSVSAGERVLLATESNSLGTVVDSARVESLPLNGRDFLQLALTAGGANPPVGNSNVIATQVGHRTGAVILASNMPETHRLPYRRHRHARRPAGRIGGECFHRGYRPVQSAAKLLHARPGTQSGARERHHQRRRH